MAFELVTGIVSARVTLTLNSKSKILRTLILRSADDLQKLRSWQKYCSATSWHADTHVYLNFTRIFFASRIVIISLIVTHLNMIFVHKFTSLHVKHFAFGIFCRNVSVKVNLKPPFQLQIFLLSSAEVPLSCFSSSIISLFLATRCNSLSLVKNTFSLHNVQFLDPQNWLQLVCLGLFVDTQLGGWDG